ncbi:hypothetical protein EC973_001092 [Apophysomyces ossiformis]|uniref:Rho-GAP domain-containing protein n=1 Tax=Apophysomyces ossiformis TaxID=679940 RepID=A0A8H7EPM0_9FUNG|nr:hypothetical protein EC973_001092 [Apophysomyces ossiformis]
MSTFEIPGMLSSPQKALVRAWWKKVTAANPKADDFKVMKLPVVDGGVFGLPLSESLRYAHSTISYIDDRTGTQCFGVIPIVIAKCGSFLKEEGLTVQGIFRLSGNAKRIGMLQTLFDTPDQYGTQLDWKGYNAHDAANVMRRFLNHLPEPVITLDYYRPFKDTMDEEFPSLEAKIDAFQNLIDCLPLAHQYLLLYLLDLLSLFSLTNEVTRMDTASLASIFAPGILSHPDDAMNPTGYKESQKVLEFLIEHQDRFSMPQPPIHRSNSITRRTSLSSTTTKATSISQQEMILKDMKSIDLTSFPSPPQRSKVYSSTSASYSATGLASTKAYSADPPATTETTTSLRRSKTAPSKRDKYGEHEPPQVVYVNKNASTAKLNTKKAGRWKSIKRVASTSEEPGIDDVKI